MAEAARKGTGIDGIEVPETPVVNVPAKNRALVKPHLETWTSGEVLDNGVIAIGDPAEWA